MKNGLVMVTSGRTPAEAAVCTVTTPLSATRPVADVEPTTPAELPVVRGWPTPPLPLREAIVVGRWVMGECPARSARFRKILSNLSEEVERGAVAGLFS